MKPAPFSKTFDPATCCIRPLAGEAATGTGSTAKAISKKAAISAAMGGNIEMRRNRHIVISSHLRKSSTPVALTCVSRMVPSPMHFRSFVAHAIAAFGIHLNNGEARHQLLAFYERPIRHRHFAAFECDVGGS